jgi:hypothetical protein
MEVMLKSESEVTSLIPSIFWKKKYVTFGLDISHNVIQFNVLTWEANPIKLFTL